MNQFIKKLYINCPQPPPDIIGINGRGYRSAICAKRINIFTRQKSPLGDLGADEK
jgi:hypothetical protein